MEKERIILLPDARERVLIKDGKKFRLVEEVIGKDEHIKKIIFEEFDEKEWNKRVEKLTDYLILKSNLSIRDVLKTVLNSVDYKTLEKLEKKMKKKVNVKIKKGCLALTMGNANIQIVE